MRKLSNASTTEWNVDNCFFLRCSFYAYSHMMILFYFCQRFTTYYFFRGFGFLLKILKIRGTFPTMQYRFDQKIPWGAKGNASSRIKRNTIYFLCQRVSFWLKNSLFKLMMISVFLY